MKKIRFNQYNIIESIDFLDPRLLNKRPVKAKMILSNQFMINPEQYIDKNIFMRLNQVETTDNRVNLFETDNEFEFFD